MLQRMRPMAWLMVAFNALLLVAIVAGVPLGGPMWFLGNGALGVVWVASMRRRRVCPQCRHEVPRTFLICNVCRYDLIPRQRPRAA